MSARDQQLRLLPRFLESAKKLPKEAKAKLVKAMWLLAQDKTHPSLNAKKVKGARSTVFVCRVDRNLRLIYDVKGDDLRCWYVGGHDVALDFASHLDASSDTALDVDEIDLEVVPPELVEVADYLSGKADAERSTAFVSITLVDFEQMLDG